MVFTGTPVEKGTGKEEGKARNRKVA